MGKGDTPRPASISAAEYGARFERIFGKQDRHAPSGVRYHTLSGDEIIGLPSSGKNEMSARHDTRTAPCERCNGTGLVHRMPMDILGLTTFDIQPDVCPDCQERAP